MSVERWEGYFLQVFFRIRLAACGGSLRHGQEILARANLTLPCGGPHELLPRRIALLGAWRWEFRALSAVSGRRFAGDLPRTGRPSSGTTKSGIPLRLRQYSFV